MGCGIIPRAPFSSTQTPIQMFNDDMYVSLLPLFLYALSTSSQESMKNAGVVEKHKTHRSQCKMSSSRKNWPVKWRCGRCLSVWGPELHTTPPLHTVYVYTYSFRERGRGESWTREKKRGTPGESTDYKAGLKIPKWLNVRKKLAINYDNTCRKVPLQLNFCRWRHFVLPSTSLIFLRLVLSRVL